MKQNVFFTFLLLFLSAISFGQSDVIILKNGDEIEAKVKIVGTQQVEYLKANSLEGPVYLVDVSNIFMIKYSNGEKDVFNTEKKSTPQVRSKNDLNKDPYQGRSNENGLGSVFTENDLHTANSITYFGIDYSNVKMVGSHGFRDFYEIKDYYLGAINSQIVKEKEKFNFESAFKKDHIEYDIYMLMHRNKSIDQAEVLVERPQQLKETTISDIVNSYNPSQEQGIGFVIIMENMNKFNDTGSMYYVFFDIKTKTVLRSEYKVGVCSGFGFRNFWMSPIHETLEQYSLSH